MNKPTEQQVKEFWEWYGAPTLLDNMQDGRRQLEINLSNLFEHAVPKALKVITKKGYCPPIMKLFQLWYDELVSLSGDSSNTQYADIALFWALWQVK